MIFQSLASGTGYTNSGSPASLHTKTARWVVEQFSQARWSQVMSPVAKDDQEEKNPWVVDKCKGIGFVSGSHEVSYSVDQ